jgi:hypothetical protein
MSRTLSFTIVAVVLAYAITLVLVVSAPAPRTSAQHGDVQAAWVSVSAAITTTQSVTTAQPEDGSDAAPAEDIECVVHLLDYRRITGLLVRDSPEEIVLRVAGIETVIDKSRIDHVQLLGSIEARYRELLKTIDPNNASQQLVIAEWLRDRERYVDAVVHARAAQRLDPRSQTATLLVRWLEAQIVLSTTPRTTAPQLPTPPASDDRNLPTREQINLVRLYELDLSDPPRLVVDPALIDELVDSYRDHPEMPPTAEGRELLRRAPPERVLELLYGIRARELYPMVTVLDDPEAVARFRRDINRGWLVNACATSRCHGGVEAGLRLRNRHSNSDATVYSNFVAINQHRTKDGRSLLDTNTPEASLLLQFALNPRESSQPHPEVMVNGRIERPRVPFRSRDDRGYQRTLAWIAGLTEPRPDYDDILGERPLWPETDPARQNQDTTDSNDRTKDRSSGANNRP